MSENVLSRRAVAGLIDLVVCIGLFALVFHFFGQEVRRGNMTVHVIRGWQALFIPVVWVFYYPFTESSFDKTLGKFLCGLSVVSSRGGDLTFGQTLLRRLLDPLEIWFGFGIVACLVASLDSDGRRLGDKLGDTRVVRDPVEASKSNQEAVETKGNG
ncbi:MAG TPA: RDD family protein [Roseimicrobium sp.]|nr:RDD family protein [Roseimicrobium sp.]